MTAARPVVPEQIPDISLSSYPYLDERHAVKLRAQAHVDAVKEQTCHAYAGREFHYCGRPEGRLFSLAAPPTPPPTSNPNVDMKTASSRPVPTLPNPNVGLKTGRRSSDKQPTAWLDRHWVLGILMSLVFVAVVLLAVLPVAVWAIFWLSRWLTPVAHWYASLFP